MIKSFISQAVRRLGLLHAVDRLLFWVRKTRARRQNNAFRRRHPEVKLPPDYLMYESFQIDYRRYFEGGKDTAQWLHDQLRQYMILEQKSVLEWGCGPGRIIRHLPATIGGGCTFYGTDYNERSIAWCRANIPEVEFSVNPLLGKVPYANATFDVIYGISIFTHLSEPAHFYWIKELYRLLRPSGILLITTQGDNFRVKLTPAELSTYDTGQLVVRGNVVEGHRTFAAFHAPAFITTLLADFELLQHTVPPVSDGQSLPQDVWIVQKPATVRGPH